MDEPATKPSFWIPSVFGITVGIILVTTTYFIHIKADDIWWHLKTGEYILSGWSLPEQNIFSFTAPEHSWLPHEWLSQVVFYLVYRALGMFGLIAFGVMLNAIACALVYLLTVRYSRSPYLSAIITLLASLMVLGNFSLRPYLFGNIFFVCTLHAMEEPAAFGRIRPVLIFLLFTSWANFHGSFIIGLALILIHLAASLASNLRSGRRGFAEAKGFLLDLVVALAACTVTPNHVFGLIFPLMYLKSAFSGEVSYLTNISEWQPAGFDSPLGRMITFYLMFCAFAVVGSWKAPRAVHIGLLAAFATFAYTTIRNIPLLGIAATPVLARHLPLTLGKAWRVMAGKTILRNVLDRFHQQSVVLDRRSLKFPIPVLTTLVLLVMFALPRSVPWSYQSLSGLSHLADLSPSFYPRGLIGHLQSSPSSHRLFHYFNWGGAIIWALFPKERVFIDQRNDCYPATVFRDYFAVHGLERDWREVLDRWEIDRVAFPADAPLTRELRDEPSWTVEYQDEQAVLFARSPPRSSE